MASGVLVQPAMIIRYWLAHLDAVSATAAVMVPMQSEFKWLLKWLHRPSSSRTSQIVSRGICTAFLNGRSLLAHMVLSRRQSLRHAISFIPAGAFSHAGRCQAARRPYCGHCEIRGEWPRCLRCCDFRACRYAAAAADSREPERQRASPSLSGSNP